MASSGREAFKKILLARRQQLAPAASPPNDPQWDVATMGPPPPPPPLPQPAPAPVAMATTPTLHPTTASPGSMVSPPPPLSPPWSPPESVGSVSPEAQRRAQQDAENYLVRKLLAERSPDDLTAGSYTWSEEDWRRRREQLDQQLSARRLLRYRQNQEGSAAESKSATNTTQAEEKKSNPPSSTDEEATRNVSSSSIASGSSGGLIDGGREKKSSAARQQSRPPANTSHSTSPSSVKLGTVSIEPAARNKNHSYAMFPQSWVSPKKSSALQAGTPDDDAGKGHRRSRSGSVSSVEDETMALARRIGLLKEGEGSSTTSGKKGRRSTAAINRRRRQTVAGGRSLSPDHSSAVPSQSSISSWSSRGGRGSDSDTVLSISVGNILAGADTTGCGSSSSSSSNNQDHPPAATCPPSPPSPSTQKKKSILRQSSSTSFRPPSPPLRIKEVRYDQDKAGNRKEVVGPAPGRGSSSSSSSSSTEKKVQPAANMQNLGRGNPTQLVLQTEVGSSTAGWAAEVAALREMLRASEAKREQMEKSFNAQLQALKQELAEARDSCAVAIEDLSCRIDTIEIHGAAAEEQGAGRMSKETPPPANDDGTSSDCRSNSGSSSSSSSSSSSQQEAVKEHRARAESAARHAKEALSQVQSISADLTWRAIHTESRLSLLATQQANDADDEEDEDEDGEEVEAIEPPEVAPNILRKEKAGHEQQKIETTGEAAPATDSAIAPLALAKELPPTTNTKATFSPPAAIQVPSPTDKRHNRASRLNRQRSSTFAVSPRTWELRTKSAGSGSGAAGGSTSSGTSSGADPVNGRRVRRSSIATTGGGDDDGRQSRYLLMSPGQRGIDDDFRRSGGRVRTGSAAVLAKLRSRSRSRAGSRGSGVRGHTPSNSRSSVYEDTLDTEQIREVRRV